MLTIDDFVVHKMLMFCDSWSMPAQQVSVYVYMSPNTVAEPNFTGIAKNSVHRIPTSVQIPRTGDQTSRTNDQVPGNRYLVPATWYLAPATWYMVAGIT